MQAMSKDSAEMRDLANELLGRDPDQALRMARSIEDPWYRCQSLAAVAFQHQDPSFRLALIVEAFAAGREAGNPTRVVTVSSWPLKVLCLQRSEDLLRQETKRLLEHIADTENPVKRGDALEAVFGAVLLGPKDLVLQVFDSFHEACLEPLASGKRNKKGNSILSWALGPISIIDPAKAEQVVAGIDSEHARARARDQIADCRGMKLEEFCFPPFL